MNNYSERYYCEKQPMSSSHARKTIWFCWLLLFCVLTVNVQAQSSAEQIQKNTPIRLGLIPHLSTQIMMKKYRPLINYLQEELQRPVIANTAPNFRTYIKRVEKGDFDIYMTAPNMAAYHEIHNKHLRLAKFTQPLQGVIVVTEDSPYQTLADLKGKSMASPDVMAVITALGEVTLKENGIEPGKDVNIKYTPSHNNALQSVAEDKADAAILGFPAYKIITRGSKLKKPTRILVKTKVIPHMMFMTPPDVPHETRQQYRQAMLNFTADGAGKVFFSGVPFENIAAITDEDMSNLEEVLLILEQRLKQ